MNKEGWGLRVELLFILMFLFCLVAATIGLNRLGLIGENDDAPLIKDPVSKDDFSYETLENKVSAAAKRYYEDNYSILNQDIVIIRITSLVSGGYMSEIKDGNNKTCSGYAKVINSSGNAVYVSYIKCSKYKTTGYESENDF